MRQHSSSGSGSGAASPGWWEALLGDQLPVKLTEVCEMAADGALGSGGFGTVHLARLWSNGRRCAVKAVPKRTLEIENFARREIDMLRRLDHARICRVLGAFEDARAIYIVQEFIEGRDLLSEISAVGPLTEALAAGVARQVFEGVKYCHEPGRDVIHRDLKPDNIMNSYTAAGLTDVKLIDFGLAIVCKGSVRTKLVGTKCYLAPEVLAKGAYSRASDLWAAGLVLHMLLTGGKLPPVVSYTGIPWPPLEQFGVSKAATDLVHGLLGQSPQDRLTAAEAGRHSWTRGDLACLQPSPPLLLVRNHCGERPFSPPRY